MPSPSKRMPRSWQPCRRRGGGESRSTQIRRHGGQDAGSGAEGNQDQQTSGVHAKIIRVPISPQSFTRQGPSDPVDRLLSELSLCRSPWRAAYGSPWSILLYCPQPHLHVNTVITQSTTATETITIAAIIGGGRPTGPSSSRVGRGRGVVVLDAVVDKCGAC
ncbi:hypothetical protein B0T14DRAFT_223599 [Immersiella caudata]|uniref:Uncharacterized protein n=1 Tax=Immersiella caudata TaxID=314043 RepID=A0AA39WRE5_9PEZI|nr:hypothetical protein B0T14DRAFT_223599 [Immersiella caudata]